MDLMITMIAVLVFVLILMVVMCVVCSKMEKSCLKLSLKANAFRFRNRKSTLTDTIKEKKASQVIRNDQIRDKYGIQKPAVSAVNETDKKSSKKKDKKANNNEYDKF